MTLKALAGLRVLDATQMLAGPMAGMRLGDLGADVIKIEPPANGEFNRTHGYGGVTLGGHMTTFLALNRNKRSLAVDLKSDEGRAVFYDLVRQSDVLLQNFRVGTVERLGIDYKVLHEINPRLVYCSISGYGSDGPGAGRPGQDLILQGYSGSMWFVGNKHEPPQPGGVPAIDAMTGYQAVIGILAALRARDTTGEGQHVEVDMLSVVLDAQVQELVTYLNTGLKPQRGEESSAHAWIPAPYGVHRTRDSWLTLAMCPLDVLGEAIGSDRLKDFSYEDALEHADEIYRIIRPILETRTTTQWIEHFDKFNIWAGPVYDYDDVENDAQVRSRGIITQMEHSEAGTVRTINVPIRLSETPGSIESPPPLLGEHTRQIVTELLGYSEEKLEVLLSHGAVKEIHSAAVVEQ
jgi:crotonobetainyl-CoA:carnitine CoA-transferase CaiB-like acyl-CoA transferase